MKVIAFLGPTLTASDALAVLGCEIRPPAAQGDVLRATLDGADMIGLIDGYFEHVPAVWHKEILFAMSEGVHVLGAASMGALRAAELCDFGMEGVGRVFADYRSGAIEADDEVAVAHASHEHRFRQSSEALVNIRATLAAAEAAQVLRAATRSGLLVAARSLYYPDRTYQRLVALGEAAGLASAELQQLCEFLDAGGRVDQKRLDALALLEALRARVAEGIAPKQVRYRFEHTDAWEELLTAVAKQPAE